MSGLSSTPKPGVVLHKDKLHMEMNLAVRKTRLLALIVVMCLLVSYTTLSDASVATGESTTTIQYAGWTDPYNGGQCWSTDAYITAECTCMVIWQSPDCTLTKNNLSDPNIQWRLVYNGYSAILMWMGNAAGFEDTLPAEPFDLDKNNGLPSCPNLVTANPINFGVGNKYKQQTDFTGSPLSQVSFQRHYNSLHAGIPMGLGPRWTHTYGSFISEAADGIGTTATVYRAGGEIYRFTEDAGAWSADADVPDVLEKLTDEQGAHTGWRYTTAEDTVETYGVNGKLQAIVDTRGVVQTLTYNSTGNLLLNVAISTGEYLDFRYDAGNRMEGIADHAGRSWGYRYTTGNLLEFVDNPDGTTRQYHYENPDYPEALTGITDENGVRYASYGYDADGQANFSTLANNVERVDIVYEPDGQRTLTNSRGNTSSYAVVSRLGMALPVRTTGPGCAGCGPVNTSYQYDAANNVTRITSDGVITEYGDYDGKGKPGYMIEAKGTSEERRTDYTYDPRFNNRVTRTLSPSVIAADPSARCTEDVDCRKTEYTYDSWGNRLTETSSGFAPDGTPVSRTTTYLYNGPLHQLSRIDGPRTDVEDVTTLEYYPDNQLEGANRARLRRVTAANGTLLRDDIMYTATGKVAQEYRPNNIQIDHAYYPGNDRLKSSTVHDLDTGESSSIAWTYLPGGEIESITTASLTPDATTLVFGYDDARRMTRITDGVGNYIEYKLDTEGNRTAENIHDTAGVLRKALTRTFDAYNRLDVSITGADPYNPLEQVDTDFSAGGNMDSETDGNGIVTGYSYDNLKRLLESTRDAGGVGAITRYGYDTAGHMISVTAPSNQETRYLYDDLDNRLATYSPDSGTTVYTYDAAGNVATRRDAKGQLFIYSYDSLNRLTGADAPTTADDINYSYDNCTNGTGMLCSVTRDGATVTYSYDAFGNVTGHQQLAYTHDAASRVRTVSYPSGAVVTYSYDAAGKVSRVDLAADGTVTTIASDISYAPFGTVTGLVFGNGATLMQELDTAYRQTAQSVSESLDLVYPLYDGNGNLRARTDTHSGSSEFGYDTLDRLNTASGPFGTRDYGYDTNGNRTQLVSDGQLTSYAYMPGSNRLAAENSWSYTLDANGDTTHKLAGDGRGFEYTYNSHNQLVNVTERVITGYTGKGRNRTPVTDAFVRAEYVYNGLGQRVSKILTDGTVVRYLYGTDGALLAELDGSGAVQREYVYLGERLLAVLDRTTVPIAGSETIVDNGMAPAGWSSTTSNKDYGMDYLYSDGGSGSTVRWTPALTAGTYDIYAWYVRNPKYSNSVAYSISHNGLTDTANVDQTSGGGDWQLLAGNIAFDGSGTEYVEVSDATGKTAADAVRLVNVGDGLRTRTRISYVHNDHLGTPQVMTDETGAVVWRATYDPFGKATIVLNTVALNVRLPGQYYDAETGLHYNYFRYYDPETGRYLTADPIGISGGLNMFLYGAGNPIVNSDLFGLSPGDTCGTCSPGSTDCLLYGGNLCFPGKDVTLDQFPVHGNWCGPGWTGGQMGSWDTLMPAQRQRVGLPQDQLDSACKTHDICYADCRLNNPCDQNVRSECFMQCDISLREKAYMAGGLLGRLVGRAMGRQGKRDPGENSAMCGCE